MQQIYEKIFTLLNEPLFLANGRPNRHPPGQLGRRQQVGLQGGSEVSQPPGEERFAPDTLGVATTLRSLRRDVPEQEGHAGFSLPRTKTSTCDWQSSHSYSKIGIEQIPLPFTQVDTNHVLLVARVELAPGQRRRRPTRTREDLSPGTGLKPLGTGLGKH